MLSMLDAHILTPFVRTRYKEIGLCTECSFEGEVGDSDRFLHKANVVLDNVKYRDLDFNRKHKHALPIANGDYVALKGSHPYTIPSGPYSDCMDFYHQSNWAPDQVCPHLQAPDYRVDERYVCIVRDPRALLVSGAHYFKKSLAKYLAQAASKCVPTISPMLNAQCYEFLSILSSNA